MVWKTCSTNGRWSAENGSCAKRWKHSPAPPQGYRKCEPENAVNSLRGPIKAQKNVASRYRRRFTDRIRTEAGEPCDLSSTTRKRGRTRHSGRIGKLRDLRLIRYADDFVVLARSRRQLETVVLPKLREFLAARGLRLSPEKTRIVRDTEGFDFVGRQFKRLTPTKFLVRPRRSSIRKHLDALSRSVPQPRSPGRPADSEGQCDHSRLLQSLSHRPQFSRVPLAHQLDAADVL